MKQAEIALIIRLLTMADRGPLALVRDNACLEVGAAGYGLWSLNTARRMRLILLLVDYVACLWPRRHEPSY